MQPRRLLALACPAFLTVTLLAGAGTGCTPRPAQPVNPDDPEVSQRTQSEFANDGSVEVRSIPMKGACQFTLVPRTPFEWSLPDCTFRVWGGGEDRLDVLMRGEPRFLMSTAPRFLMCFLPAKDNAGQPSTAAVAVEFRWRQVALGQSDLRGVTRMEFFVDRAGVMSLRRAYDPDRKDGTPPDAGGGK